MRSREEMVSLVIKRAAVFCLPSVVLLAVLGLSGCKTAPPPDPQSQLIAKGRDIFFNETFAGNGSHGCVNMAPDDAKWLYNHTAYGTTVIIY